MPALLTGIAPLLPGLAHSINGNLSVTRGAQEFYILSWLDALPYDVVTVEDVEGEDADVEGSNPESVVDVEGKSKG
ncbi:hypothetical protein LTR36_003515 [Oleoguttula mirabilis]|uniref:Uncharacterized protein n=1 Tax=Oleoguttula mirabilis TaxID=1507867 RepID=A0AAV9JJ98_9PEZI|nr:hypothetical protein LTR36_003515 [Oleoguttula mirabilis]